jgi:hypothetical protein
MQELLDVTRSLLADMGAATPAGAKSGDQGGDKEKPVPELKLDADQDEIREKFGIVRVRQWDFGLLPLWL